MPTSVTVTTILEWTEKCQKVIATHHVEETRTRYVEEPIEFQYLDPLQGPQHLPTEV